MCFWISSKYKCIRTFALVSNAAGNTLNLITCEYQRTLRTDRFLCLNFLIQLQIELFHLHTCFGDPSLQLFVSNSFDYKSIVTKVMHRLKNLQILFLIFHSHMY
jgi:hypothetical protein